MNIINGRFNADELSLIYKIIPILGRIRDISIYNDAPDFDIQKFYKDGELVGYAVVFLEYKGIELNSALLEDIAFWKGTPDDLDFFLKKVLEAKDYSLPVENIYYEPGDYPELICQDLDKLGYKSEKIRQR